MIRWNLKNVTVCERKNLTMLIKSFSSFFFISDDGTINSIVGSAKAKNPAEPAKLEVSFDDSKEI